MSIWTLHSIHCMMPPPPSFIDTHNPSIYPSIPIRIISPFPPLSMYEVNSTDHPLVFHQLCFTSFSSLPLLWSLFEIISFLSLSFENSFIVYILSNSNLCSSSSPLGEDSCIWQQPSSYCLDNTNQSTCRHPKSFRFTQWSSLNPQAEAVHWSQRVCLDAILRRQSRRTGSIAWMWKLPSNFEWRILKLIVIFCFEKRHELLQKEILLNN